HDDQTLGVADLEHARAAAAAADRREVVAALLAAGAEQALAEHLANALLSAECIGQLARLDGAMATPLRGLTVVVAPSSAFTCLQAQPRAARVALTLPSRGMLHQQVSDLWT